MSGIFGVVLRREPNQALRCGGILKRMREALPLNTAVDDDEWTSKDGRIGLGAIHAGKIDHPNHFAYDKTRGVVCLLDGYLFSNVRYPSATPHNKSGAAYLLQQYLDAGPTCVRDISGSFNVTWYEEKKDRLVLATDKIGQRLMFYGSRNGHFVFGSYIARLMAADLLSRDIDIESLADLMRIAYIPGQGTLFKDIRCMPTGSILTLENKDATLEKYWRIDQIEPHGSYDTKRLDEIEVLFKTAVSRALSSGVDTAIGLTGGLDSRCILAAAANMQLSFITHTGGQTDSTDVIYAKRAAEETKSRHFFEFIGPDKMVEWLYPMVLFQGGIAATLHSHPCQHFGMSFPFKAYIQGIGPHYLKPWNIRPEHFHIHEKSDVIAALKKRILKPDLEQIGFENIWNEKYKQVCSAALDKHLISILDNYEKNDSMIAFIDFFGLHEFCRKFLNKANMIVRNDKEIYLPYLDHEFISALATLSIKDRVTNRIQVDLLKRLYPKLLNVPLTNTMLPIPFSLPQSRLAVKYTETMKKVKNRLGISKRKTFVPNHYLPRWSRQEMREGLIKILYNPKAAFREYLDWGTVEMMLGAHFSGKHNWESVLSALVVFEISHNLWVEEQKIPDFYEGFHPVTHDVVEHG